MFSLGSSTFMPLRFLARIRERLGGETENSEGFAEPQGVDQRLIGDPLARVAGTPCVELVEERQTLLLHRVEWPHGGLLLACLVPTGGRLAHPAPAIIPSVSGAEARCQAAGPGRWRSAAPC